MRILIAYEDSHRAYGEALASVIQATRPQVDVSLVRARNLTPELARFDPHLAICNRPNAVDPGDRSAWVRLSNEPGKPSEACVDGRRRSVESPDRGDLLAIVDEVDELLRNENEVGGC